jgi:hypothetical protein
MGECFKSKTFRFLLAVLIWLFAIDCLVLPAQAHR